MLRRRADVHPLHRRCAVAREPATNLECAGSQIDINDILVLINWGSSDPISPETTSPSTIYLFENWGSCETLTRFGAHRHCSRTLVGAITVA